MATPDLVIQQQPVLVPRVTAWNTGLCHCCQDMNSCCYAYWCFPCFMCSTSSKFGESLCLPLVDIFGPALMAATGVGLCVPPVTLSMRVVIRYRYQIPGSLCEDILISCFCVYCSWTQMSREIKPPENDSGGDEHTAQGRPNHHCHVHRTDNGVCANHDHV